MYKKKFYKANRRQITIIGAGISGLATAALLAKDGFNVVVLEKNDF